MQVSSAPWRSASWSCFSAGGRLGCFFGTGRNKGSPLAAATLTHPSRPRSSRTQIRLPVGPMPILTTSTLHLFGSTLTCGLSSASLSRTWLPLMTSYSSPSLKAAVGRPWSVRFLARSALAAASAATRSLSLSASNAFALSRSILLSTTRSFASPFAATTLTHPSVLLGPQMQMRLPVGPQPIFVTSTLQSWGSFSSWTLSRSSPWRTIKPPITTQLSPTLKLAVGFPQSGRTLPNGTNTNLSI
mmetsp:Transcript_102984/g.332262  ORF Transcript_102984/g.332262 Transcript_102984/m.332262 type:complete len:244 (+) Transcript_102984:29-760(+)